MSSYGYCSYPFLIRFVFEKLKAQVHNTQFRFKAV